MAYHLEGRLLEVCDCRVLCPCWIGEDPDYGTCDTIVAWHFDKGKIGNVDVSGHTVALLAHVPGNILEGNWRAAVYLDDKVSPEQEAAILDVYTGKLGGPVGELVKLVGEVVSVQKVPITFETVKIISLAKIFCAEIGTEIMDQCLQFHGGAGYIEEMHIARGWRDQRLLKIGGGTTETMRYYVAKLMGL